MRPTVHEWVNVVGIIGQKGVLSSYRSFASCGALLLDKNGRELSIEVTRKDLSLIRLEFDSRFSILDRLFFTNLFVAQLYC